MKLFHLFAIVLLSNFLQGQVATVSNDRPSWGDIVEISYTPDSASKFKLGDEIYVSYSMYREDFRTEYETMKMRRTDESFIYQLEISESASVYDIYFRNQEKDDSSVELVIKPIDDDGEFYRNSYGNIAYSDLEAYEKEMNLFPDNYILFVERWRTLDYVNKDSAKAIIKSELESIASLNFSPEKMSDPTSENGSREFALSMGYGVLGDFDRAWPHFISLMEDYPESGLQYNAQSLYHYMLYSHSGNDSSFMELMYSYTKSNPTSPIAREWMRLVDKPNDSDRATMKEIGKYWMKEEPSNARTKYYYAKAFQDSKEKIYYLNDAVNTLLNADLSVKMYYTWGNGIPRLLPLIAQEFNNAGAHVQALSLIELFEKNSNKESAWLYRLKGMALQSLNNYEEAFELYSLSADMGDKVSADSAKSVFTKMDLFNVDFENYTNDILSKLFYSEEVVEAPKFDVKDVYGNSYKSEDLVGKVVVLNFWFIGCAPCIKEMPALNEMVKDYEGKDVVFIAFANDKEESLTKFLKEREFKYNVIPASGSIANSYDVNSYPTHVIIDKKGNVRATLTGGSVDRHKDIMPYIDRVLRF